MTNKQKIAAHFGIDAQDLSFRVGIGWHYKNRFLHRSLHEVQCSPGWATKNIEAYFFGR